MTEEIRLEFDIDQMVIDDFAFVDEMWELYENAQEGAPAGGLRPGMIRRLVELLKRCGGEEAGRVPVSQFGDVVGQLMEAIGGASNPKN